MCTGRSLAQADTYPYQPPRLIPRALHPNVSWPWTNPHACLPQRHDRDSLERWPVLAPTIQDSVAHEWSTGLWHGPVRVAQNSPSGAHLERPTTSTGTNHKERCTLLRVLRYDHATGIAQKTMGNSHHTAPQVQTILRAHGGFWCPAETRAHTSHL